MNVVCFGHTWNSSTLYDTIEVDHFPTMKKKKDLQVRNKMGTFLGRLDTLNKDNRCIIVN